MAKFRVHFHCKCFPCLKPFRVCKIQRQALTYRTKLIDTRLFRLLLPHLISIYHPASMALPSSSVFLFSFFFLFVLSFFFHFATFVSTVFSLKVFQRSTWNVGEANCSWCLGEEMSENLMPIYRYIRWLIEHRNGIAVYRGDSLISPVSSRTDCKRIRVIASSPISFEAKYYQNEYACSIIKIKIIRYSI